MTRTSPLVVALTVLAAAALAWLLQTLLVGGGRPAIVPPLTLGIALALLGALLLAVAWPVRQATRGKRRVHFRHATSVLGFAKASSIVGALLGGAALGTLGFLLTRHVIAQDAVLATLVAVSGAIVQLVAGLVAEHWCVLPPDDEDDVAQVAGSAA